MGEIGDADGAGRQSMLLAEISRDLVYVAPGALLLARIGQVRDVELVIGVPLEIRPDTAPGLLELLDDAPGAVDFAAWWSEAVGAAFAEG